MPDTYMEIHCLGKTGRRGGARGSIERRKEEKANGAWLLYWFIKKSSYGVGGRRRCAVPPPAGRRWPDPDFEGGVRDGVGLGDVAEFGAVLLVCRLILAQQRPDALVVGEVDRVHLAPEPGPRMR